MNVQCNETVREHDAVAIGIWENEGGAPDRNSMDHQYGRRIEADRSWTVYHVFTGVPARANGQAMVGLSQSAATSGMLTLNVRNANRRKERLRLSSPRLSVFETLKGLL